MAGNFVKCPRCELNYIDKTRQEYCDVCLAELKLGPSLKFADLDDSLLEDDVLDVCPVCKVNYIKFNETICEDCLKEKSFEKEDSDESEDDDWKEYLDDDVTEDDDLTIDEFDVDLDEESELDDEDAEFEDDEDFDFDYADLDEDDYDEDDDEDEDDFD